MIIKASKEKIKANTLKAKAAFFIKSSLLQRCTIAAAPPNPNPEVGAVAEFDWFSTSATGGAVGSVGVDSTCWWFDLGSSKFDMFLEVYMPWKSAKNINRTKAFKGTKIVLFFIIYLYINDNSEFVF